MKILELMNEIEVISNQCHEKLTASMDDIDSALQLMTARHAMLEELFNQELSESDYASICTMLSKIRHREGTLLEPYRHLYDLIKESILNFNKITKYLEA